ncbi:MAG: Pelagibacter phage [Fusobacteriota bacterium]|jgi:hypothetical protein
MEYVMLGSTVMEAANKDAAGRFNQKVYNRNAQIAEQEREAIKQQTELELARFDDNFSKLQSQSKVRILTSGADLSGSGLKVLHNNEVQKQIEKNVMTYNSQVQQISKTNEAAMSRVAGQFARDQGRSAAIGSIAKGVATFGQSSTGKTLLDNIPNPFSKNMFS